MRRSIRHVMFKAATVLSLVLCMLITVGWIRSDFVAEHWTFRQGESGISYQIALHSGGLNLSKSRWESVAWRRDIGWSHSAVARGELPEDYRYFRVWEWFKVEFGDGGWNRHFVFVRIPFWFMFLCTAILPAAVLRTRITRRRHHPAGLCPACGYDLRATPERCPECGAHRRA